MHPRHKAKGCPVVGCSACAKPPKRTHAIADRVMELCAMDAVAFSSMSRASQTLILRGLSLAIAHYDDLTRHAEDKTSKKVCQKQQKQFDHLHRILSLSGTLRRR